MIDSLAAKKTGEPRDSNLVGFSPAARERSSEDFPGHARRCGTLERSHQGGKPRFEAAAASPRLAELMRTFLHASGRSEDWCKITTGSSAELMQRAAAGMVASGTATLEAAYFGCRWSFSTRWRG
jgi:lipid-A-disaccharide synthase